MGRSVGLRDHFWSRLRSRSAFLPPSLHMPHWNGTCARFLCKCSASVTPCALGISITRVVRPQCTFKWCVNRDVLRYEIYAGSSGDAPRPTTPIIKDQVHSEILPEPSVPLNKKKCQALCSSTGSTGRSGTATRAYSFIHSVLSAF